ncbi:MAG: pantetheine-phosphate adenylyltransferase [Eggerthellaceae bacterium]|nr:pantetheine-phosphate adenylyltransferase [Eggerthellaceae bacterium]
MKRAIVPGTFDPITEGHIDVIRRAAQIFDEVIVGVAESAGKGPLFSLEERVSLAKQSLEDIDNVRVEPFDDLLTTFANRMDAKIVVKGLRAITDFEYEFQQAALNYELSRELETVFIMSPTKFMYLSSSIVRELARLGGEISQFVTPCVKEALQRKFNSAQEGD